MPVGVAIVGTGYGARVQLPVFAALPGATVRVLVGRDPDKTQQIARDHGVPVATTSLEEALGDPGVDLVCIATPPDLHAAQATAALAAGKHVLCEKPLALDTGAAEAMCVAARRAPGQLALVDHQLRFAPAVQRLQRLVADGYVGTPLVADIRVVTPRELDRARPFGWWHESRRGGGALGAYGSHAVDLACLLLGEPQAVGGGLHTFVGERVPTGDVRSRPVDSDDWALAWLEHGRQRVVLQVSAVAAGGTGLRFMFYGTDGMLELDPEGGLSGRRGSSGLEVLATPAPLPEPLRGRVPDTAWSLAFVEASKAIVEAIAAKRSTLAGAATFADGLAVQRVLDAVRASARSGRRIEVARG